MSYQMTEPGPAESNNTGQDRSDISAVTGAGSLVEEATVDLTVGQVYRFEADGEYQTWKLRGGTLATETATKKRPDDYNASTNAKYWERLI